MKNFFITVIAAMVFAQTTSGSFMACMSVNPTSTDEDNNPVYTAFKAKCPQERMPKNQCCIDTKEDTAKYKLSCKKFKNTRIVMMQPNGRC